MSSKDIIKKNSKEVWSKNFMEKKSKLFGQKMSRNIWSENVMGKNPEILCKKYNGTKVKYFWSKMIMGKIIMSWKKR